MATKRTQAQAPLELTVALVEALGKEDGPLGMCGYINQPCIRTHGLHGDKAKYCQSCWGYVIACELQALLREAARHAQ